MDIKDLIQSKLIELDISLAEFANRLTLRGHDISKAGVYNWVTGKAKPPISDKEFRYKLASVLEMDVDEMLKILGYITTLDERSPFTRRITDIIEHLPDDGKELALDYLEMLEKRYIEKSHN